MAAALVWLAALGMASEAAAGLSGWASNQAGQAVRCQFRVFAGTEEVTGQTRIRVALTGAPDPAVAVEPRVPVSLAPGLYDVQAVRVEDDMVRAIRRAGRIVVVRDPDEGDLHLEVLNLDPRFGALQLRSPAAGGRPPTFTAQAYDPGNRDQPVATSLPGDAYALLVLPGGIYDIRIQASSTPNVPKRADLWLLGVEIQADRSRLKVLPPDWGRSAGLHRP